MTSEIRKLDSQHAKCPLSIIKPSIPVEDVLTTSTSAPVTIQSGSGNATQRMVLNKNDEIRVKVHAGKG